MRCLFLDAFKPEYLKHTPYIKGLAKKNLHGELEVPLGFTSIIASFLTGKNPDKHKVIDIFTLTKPKKQISNKYLVSALNLLKNKRFFYTPLKTKQAKFFKLTLQKAWPQKNCLRIPTLFDILEKNKISFTFIDWPNHYTNRKARTFLNNSTENIIKLTKKAKTKFTLAHFSDLEIAHKYGINSIQTKQALKRIDNAVKELDTKDLILFSDHGMDNIENKFNLKAKLDKLNLKYGKDYVYFLGSTIVRFWFKNKQAQTKIKDLLKTIKQGKIIDFKKYNLPKTCSLIFLANFKTIFYPNFFNTRYKAMHGWDPKIQKAFYLIKGQKGKQNKKITDLLPHILKTLNIN